ncbi:MAG: hypothetical protein ACO4CW_05805 [Planctomycetota bacterium]
MLSPRHTPALLVWCLLAAALLLLGDDREVRGIAAEPESLRVLRGIDLEAVRELTVSLAGRDRRLRREGERWGAPDHPGVDARADRVERAIAGLLSVSGARARGASVQSHAALGVEDGGAAFTLEGAADGLPLTLRVGAADGFERCFVRVGDEPEVHSVTPNLRYDLELGPSLEVDDWLDLLLSDLPDSEGAVRATFRTESGTISMVRLQKRVVDAGGALVTPELWQVTEPEAFLADQQIVDGFLQSARRTQAPAGADPAQRSMRGVPAARRSVEVECEGGEVVRVDVGRGARTADGRDGVYARRSGEETLYILPPWTRTNLFKTLDQLRPAE